MYYCTLNVKNCKICKITLKKGKRREKLVQATDDNNHRTKNNRATNNINPTNHKSMTAYEEKQLKTIHPKKRYG